MSDLYCKVFVDITKSVEEFAALIVDEVGGHREGFTIRTSCLEFDIRENKEADEVALRARSDGFMFSKLYLDVFKIEGIARSEYIRAINALLRIVERLGGHAVAAAKFEEELYRKGGFDRPSPPA